MKLILAVLLLLSAIHVQAAPAPDCRNSTPGWEQMHTGRLTLSDDTGAAMKLRVRIADDHLELASGYQWLCPETVRNTGILFVFPRPYGGAFYMKDVFVPLDILYFDTAQRIINNWRMQAVPPGSNLPIRYYRPTRNAAYALELPAGTYQKHGLNPSHMHFSLDTPAVSLE